MASTKHMQKRAPERRRSLGFVHSKNITPVTMQRLQGNSCRLLSAQSECLQGKTPFQYYLDSDMQEVAIATVVGSQQGLVHGFLFFSRNPDQAKSRAYFDLVRDGLMGNGCDFCAYISSLDPLGEWVTPEDWSDEKLVALQSVTLRSTGAFEWFAQTFALKD